jgi:DnaJ-class molecular chaperone
MMIEVLLRANKAPAIIRSRPHKSLNALGIKDEASRRGFSTSNGFLDFDPRINYYQVLGISSSATDSEIKRAFYALAKRYHPDSQQQQGAASSAEKGKQTSSSSNEERFKEISNAYDVLSDSGKRARYDEMRGGFGGRASNSNNGKGGASARHEEEAFRGGFYGGAEEQTFSYDANGRKRQSAKYGYYETGGY